MISPKLRKTLKLPSIKWSILPHLIYYGKEILKIKENMHRTGTEICILYKTNEKLTNFKMKIYIQLNI